METNFSRHLHCPLPPAELWKQFSSALRYSRAHSFWPNQLKETRCHRLKEGGKIHSVYHTPLADFPVTYRISAHDPARFTLSYETTEDHPLEGHASIIVTADPSGGSRLSWEGRYTYPWHSPAGLFLRSYFLPRFFPALKEGLAHLPARPRRNAA